MIQPLFPMQKGMLFHHRLEPNSQQYFEQMVLTAEGPLDIRTFEKSFNLLIERYDALRTVFLYEEMEAPLQVVLVERKTAVYYEDLSALNEQEQQARIEQFTYQDRKSGFDLQSDILIRASVFRIHPNSHKIILSNHHIIMDGWCLGIVMKDLLHIYEQINRQQNVQLNQAPSNRSYAQWLEQQDEEEALAYWHQVLEGFEERTGIPRKSSDSTRPGEYDGRESWITLGVDLTTALQHIALKNQVTLNHVFLGMWGILLQRYNLTSDIALGTVISGRPPEVEGIENMVGLFINTIPIRITSRKGERFPDLLAHIQQTLLLGEKYGYASLADIQARSELRQDLFDHIVSFQNFSNRTEVADAATGGNAGLQISDAEVFERTNYPLTVMVQPGEQLIIKINYDGHIYDRKMIERLGTHLIQLADTLSKNPEALVSEIDMVTAGEKEQLLYGFNDTKTVYPQDQTIYA
ncbi:condensation domain-containing protein, partial [Paenibacillus pinihumi]|uniref:condensation domain-containing protein n=1 Tax=Paenibacillus pinihumi TaxID=669462 RepID=UPI001FE0601E